MYKLIFSVLIFSVPAFHKPPAKRVACCGGKANAAFVAFTKDPRFTTAHSIAPKIRFDSKEGRDIYFATVDGQKGHGFLFSSEKPSNKYLILVHDFLGLGDYAKYEALRYYHDLSGVNVLAIDLYDKKVTANRDTAVSYMKAVKPERAVSIIKGALKYTGDDAKIATIGWCFGGGWSLQTALTAGKKLSGCVVFYGMPETDTEKLKTLNSDVLGIYANKDQWITPVLVGAFQENMKKAGKNLIVKKYDADHGFSNPSSPSHNDVAAADAYQQALKYLKTKF